MNTMHVEKHQITQDQLEEIIAMAKPCNLKGANLKGANLEGAYLESVYLVDACLVDACLKRANLEGANLEGANLEGANLKDAYLKDAYLKDAYLKGAYLKGAYLHDAYLESAYLHDAYLEGAVGILSLSIPGMSSRGDILYAVRHTDCVMVKTGYFWDTLDVLEQEVLKEHGTTSEQAKLYTAVIQLLHVWGTARE